MKRNREFSSFQTENYTRKLGLKMKISSLICVLMVFQLSVTNLFAKEGLSDDQSKEVTGTVVDSNGELLPGANVLVKGTSTGTQTNFDGEFTIEVPEGSTALVVSFVGYQSQEVNIEGKTSVNVRLEEDSAALEQIVLVGSRNPSRTAVETVVAIDVIDVAKLGGSSGQTSVSEILNTAAPSFTSQTQTVADGTDHLDPASLRGLGPDQVLVLINGKRRHNSALINVNGTVGQGSVGTDMNAIPTAAIKRIEVLRDGAAAQYGSDAIAGVINIVLKKATGKLDLSLTTGANVSDKSDYLQGGVDGEKIQLDANYGLKIGDNGFINFTGSLATRDPALRNGEYTGAIYNAFHGAERIFAANGGVVANMTLQDYATAAQGLDYLDAAAQTTVTNFLGGTATDQDLRDALNVNADEGELAARGLTRNEFRFRVGTSKLREGKFFANMSIPLDEEKTEFYAFGGISYRSGLSAGFYRRPAQSDGRANTPVFPNGFLPFISTDILDKSLSFGIKGVIGNGWDIDFSHTYGQNIFAIEVQNSSNTTLGTGTQTTFNAGGFGFTQNTTNLGLSRFYGEVFSGLNVAFGAEYKVENYRITAGEEASYAVYDVNGDVVTNNTPSANLVRNNFTNNLVLGGAQVFRGYDPDNATNNYRDNISGYIDIEADFTEKWLFSVAGRYENYSDFGDTYNYKLATRYKITDGFIVRGAHSTGFRAPSLHQQFFSRTATIFDENGDPVEQSTFTNDSRVAELIGIEELKEETSVSFSAGLTAKLGSSVTVTLDAYQINIDDRIVYSGQFGDGGDPEIAGILGDAGANAARFLVNAIDTRSQGIDLVVTHKMNFSDNVKLVNDLAGTFNRTEVTNVVVPERIAASGQSNAFFDGQEEAFLTLAQPRAKVNLTNRLTVGSWDFMLRSVYYGEVIDPDDFAGQTNADGTFLVADKDNASDDAIYGAKIVTDLSVTKGFGENLRLTVGANNLLDVFPDRNREGADSGNQFVYSRRTSQFGYAGRYVFARLNLSL